MCEAWRCQFAEGLQQCEIASEQGRKHCLAHLAFKPKRFLIKEKARHRSSGLFS